jgi:hypothetical protein
VRVGYLGSFTEDGREKWAHHLEYAEQGEQATMMDPDTVLELG